MNHHHHVSKSSFSNIVSTHIVLCQHTDSSQLQSHIFLEPIAASKINSQSLEDTQVGYILQKYTLDNYTLEKYTLAQKSLVMVATSLVMVSTSLVTVATSLALLGGHQRRLLHRNVNVQSKFKSIFSKKYT